MTTDELGMKPDGRVCSEPLPSMLLGAWKVDRRRWQRSAEEKELMRLAAARVVAEREVKSEGESDSCKVQMAREGGE
jgi:hypothetical protein